jgi:hypothetical protein
MPESFRLSYTPRRKSQVRKTCWTKEEGLLKSANKSEVRKTCWTKEGIPKSAKKSYARETHYCWEKESHRVPVVLTQRHWNCALNNQTSETGKNRNLIPGSKLFHERDRFVSLSRLPISSGMDPKLQAQKVFRFQRRLDLGTHSGRGSGTWEEGTPAALLALDRKCCVSWGGGPHYQKSYWNSDPSAVALCSWKSSSQELNPAKNCLEALEKQETRGHKLYFAIPLSNSC